MEEGEQRISSASTSHTETRRFSGLTQILTNYNKEESPMITIQCDGGDVEAKKSLLVAVSDVFKAMLESDMLEKRTNHVLANDVNFETMKTVMDYYKEGTISGFEAMNRDAFTYVVEKYNFLGIKEEIAEYLLENYFIKQDVNILESIFFFYGDKCKKITVIKEIALIVTGGKKAPKFVANFNGFEFTEFAKVCSAALIGSTFDRYHKFFETLYKWASTKPEERSVAVLEIIGMIDMTLFSNENVQTLLKNLKLSQKFQGLKSLLEQCFSLLPNPGSAKIFFSASHKIPACDFSIFTEMNRASALTKILANFDKKESPLITIRCDGGDVEAQKPLLTAISDVFKAVLEPDLLEKPTNIVLANDVNYETMKTIIDYYKEGSVFGFETMNRDAFTYIVEKYKFLGIKEEIAEYLLLSNFIKQDVKFLENIFFTYGTKCKKITVIKEMALMTAEGKEAPQFVADFNAPDFLEFAKCCCDALTGRKFDGFDGFLETLYNWLSVNSEERSVAVLEIVGMIDMRNFSRLDVQNLLEDLHLSPKFQGLKLILLKSLDFIEETHTLLSSFTENSGLKECHHGSVKCDKCDHDSNYPFHKDPDCSGIHFCHIDPQLAHRRRQDPNRHSGACKKHFSHPNKPFF